MGVAFFVAVLVVDAVGGYPGDGSAFKGECSADGEKVLDELGDLVAAVDEEAVVAHADAEVDGKDVEDDGDNEVCPTEEKERGDHADVEDDHKDGGDPDEAGLGLSAAHADVGGCGGGALVRSFWG